MLRVYGFELEEVKELLVDKIETVEGKYFSTNHNTIDLAIEGNYIKITIKEK